MSAILIVGLGNPGKQYEKTRHNAGFMVLDSLAKVLEEKAWKLNKQARAEVLETRQSDRKLILVKPQTFMNLSGEAVASLASSYKVEPRNTWVVSDDTALPLGTVRVRVGGSAGGHNGLKSLIEHIGEGFVRFRLGVGPQPEHIPLEDFVLQAFSKTETAVLKESVSKTRDIILHSLTNGVEQTSLS